MEAEAIRGSANTSGHSLKSRLLVITVWMVGLKEKSKVSRVLSGAKPLLLSRRASCLNSRRSTSSVSSVSSNWV